MRSSPFHFEQIWFYDMMLVMIHSYFCNDCLILLNGFDGGSIPLTCGCTDGSAICIRFFFTIYKIIYAKWMWRCVNPLWPMTTCQAQGALHARTRIFVFMHTPDVCLGKRLHCGQYNIACEGAYNLSFSSNKNSLFWCNIWSACGSTSVLSWVLSQLFKFENQNYGANISKNKYTSVKIL